MSPQRQKGKHRKRPRGWHRGPLEDQRFAAAVKKLDGCPDRDTPPNEETTKEGNRS